MSAGATYLILHRDELFGNSSVWELPRWPWRKKTPKPNSTLLDDVIADARAIRQIALIEATAARDGWEKLGPEPEYEI
jgi:hypothetical protein